MRELIIFAIAAFSLSSYASHYVSGVQKVTFRTGPGTDNKIVKMLATDTKLELIEQGESWSKVKLTSGEEGYILTRFLSAEVPAIVKFNYVSKKLKKSEDKYKKVISENKDLKTQIKDLTKKLEGKTTDLNLAVKNYDELKSGSQNYISLKDKFDKTSSSLKNTNSRLKELESKVNVHYIKWFLAGAGVLLLGWLIGLISRKKKKYSGLSL